MPAARARATTGRTAIGSDRGQDNQVHLHVYEAVQLVDLALQIVGTGGRKYLHLLHRQCARRQFDAASDLREEGVAHVRERDPILRNSAAMPVKGQPWRSRARARQGRFFSCGPAEFATSRMAAGNSPAASTMHSHPKCLSQALVELSDGEGFGQQQRGS
jgi:hypothetical protein